MVKATLPAEADLSPGAVIVAVEAISPVLEIPAEAVKAPQ